MSSSVVIVGGGVMGAATACFLARDHGMPVTVLERDPTYSRAASALSASSIRQQFSQPVNIALSQWSLAFLRRGAHELAVEGDAPALGLVEAGYLYLAGDALSPVLRSNHAVQRAAGADVALLAPEALAARFPWLSVEGVVLGSIGCSGEGWFDGPALLHAFRGKARACGVEFVTAQAVGFDSAHDRVSAVLASDGRRFDAQAVVIAAGAWSSPIAARLGVELPVVAKKRDVFVFDAPAVPPGCPLVIDPSGVWFRPEGRGFIAGAAPRDDSLDEEPLDAIDHAWFDEHLWPVLAARVPAFEALRLRSAWAGYYEMNLFDHNGLAGALPGWRNAYTACGFSGHGMQQAPAVGCALARLIAVAPPEGPDIGPLSPCRIAEGLRLLERNVI
jgi:FAD-dependent oxidoreductase domain-containing protein 1